MEPEVTKAWWEYLKNQHIGWILAEFSIVLQFGYALFKKIAAMTKTKIDDAIVGAADETLSKDE